MSGYCPDCGNVLCLCKEYEKEQKLQQQIIHETKSQHLRNMKLIVAGGRDIIEGAYHLVSGAILFYGLDNMLTEIVSGGCSGIDEAGEIFAIENHLEEYPIVNRKIDVRIFHADWKTHGKAAGPIRNRQMAEYADALLLIWDGKSKGSSSMKNEMLKLNKPIYEVILNIKEK